uniref:Uncharacterized protein n=1 Tax=Trichobilharzia regenti TaxID=157069 RepID=A0AA85J9U7_TRIRE|nr:unnamed protein product [Trichobilharzia regenti]
MATEVEINPFRPGGELSKEVDDILKNSYISRDTIIINDPALRRANGNPTSVDGVVPNNIHIKSGDSSFKSQASNGPNIADISSHSSGPVTFQQHFSLSKLNMLILKEVENLPSVAFSSKTSVHRVKDIIDNRKK